MKFKFCPKCKNDLIEVEDNGKKYSGCPCGCFIHYDNPNPVAVGVVPKINDDGKLELLMVKRSTNVEDGHNKWALPGGNVESKEDPKIGMLTELKEETGLVGRLTGKIFDTTNPLPGVLNKTLIYYEVEVEDYSTLKVDGTENTDLGFYGLHTGLPDMAFDDHERIARGYLKNPNATSLMKVVDFK